MLKTAKKYAGAVLLAAILMPLFASAATKQFTYTGWLPFWKKTEGAQDISLQLEHLQELSPFSYEVGANGKLVDKLKVHDGFWPDWLAAVKDMHIKIVPTLAWFDGPAIHSLLSNKKKRIAHEDAVTKLVKDEKYDGIDIDYESKLAETAPYFSLFIEGLGTRLHAAKKTLVCTIEPRTPPSSAYRTIPADLRRANDYPVLNKYCDEVRIMAYDQGATDVKLDDIKGNGNFYMPVADPLWAEKVIKETLKDISPRKVMLGIPTYGYEYEVSWANGFTTYKRLRSRTFSQAMELAQTLNITPARNSAGELSFVYATSSPVSVSSILQSVVPSVQPKELLTAPTTPDRPVVRFVSFSDAQSASGLIKLAKKYNLKGAAFFKLDGDQDPLLWSFMK